ncbi:MULTISPECIES: hypothetical protein [Bacillus cereus group]|uniref:hypothetical protein n=1 Tax=Bacillus cereus group TaxID=86661 RepID=UPI0007721873|nr:MULTISPECIES: hypothetical protein [Bacillus cereus group]KXI51978.1 hypothetical protein ACS95_11055 [Bacillus cereus]MDA1898275.1 hypothetical protein [Bacillus cereus group sp. BcHK28]MED1447366.1 hypothetical protein [Bacillus pacificus]NKX00887.1 hypothetical protein [Bacillus cereus]
MVELNKVDEKIKKPIWKKRSFWIIGVIILLFLSSKLGMSNNIPDGIEKEFYNDSLEVFHELNVSMEDRKLPDEKVISWVAEQERNIVKNPEGYTEKEKYISANLRSWIVNIGNLVEYGGDKGLELELRDFEKKSNTARANLAGVLEIDEDY